MQEQLKDSNLDKVIIMIGELSHGHQVKLIEHFDDMLRDYFDFKFDDVKIVSLADEYKVRDFIKQEFTV